MDFLDPKKRKKHRTRLYIGYGLMGLLVVMVSSLLLLQAYGYTYNIRTGDISQNGLLFVGANPVPATLAVNGESKGITNQRLVLREGSYDISLQREGYHSWEKTVDLKGGVIERFLYPFLFPTDVQSEDVALYAEHPAFASQSPDRNWLLIQVPGSIDTFEVMNLSDDTLVPNRFTLPRNVMTVSGKKHVVELVEWSTDNRHVVIRHDFDGNSEFILIDRDEPQTSVNLTDTIPVEFDSLRLRDKAFNSYYLYDALKKSLSRFDSGDLDVSPVLANVLAYQPHGDDELLYVTDEGKSKSKTVKLRVIENGETYTLRNLDRSDRYLLDLAQYDGMWFLVAGVSQENKVYVFRNPVDLLRQNSSAKIVPAAVLRVDNPQSVSFSQNTRIIAAQSASNVAVYDAENKRTIHYDTKLALATDEDFVWMDGHRLTAIVDGVHHVFDFDGSNRHTLGSGYDDYQPFFSTDYSEVFTLAPSTSVEGRAALQQTELLIEEQ